MTTQTVEKETACAPTPNEAELKELGFTTAADNIATKRKLAQKLRIAFEHFRVITPEILQRFQGELAKKTKRTREFSYTYDRLVFTPVARYGAVPPSDVLDEVRKAKELGCFDDFEVGTLESVTVVPDPIIVGVIHGCANKYFIAQWDDDVKIEDILRPEEG